METHSAMDSPLALKFHFSITAMDIRMQEDYPLKGEITSFEAYMFMTTKKFINKHAKFPHENFFVCHGESTDEYSLGDLQSRKDGQHNFNVYLTQHLGHFPKAEDLGCFIAYMKGDKSVEEDERAYFNAYNFLSSMVSLFCEVGNRVVSFVPHFHQGDNCPHVHFLYQRSKVEENILQRCLTAMMENDFTDQKFITEQKEEDEEK